MDFSDRDHNLTGLVFQGADRLDPSATLDTTILAALDRWGGRTDSTDPSSEYFQFPTTQCFSISYDGKADQYWPDDEQNWLNETLIRDFLFSNGICVIDEFKPRLYAIRYKVEALTDTEHLLICPYATAADNIGGIVVVCVNQHVR